MAQVLGVSDEAAQKRVSRAVDRLRELLAKRGVTVGAGGLAVVISANAVQAAPVGLAATISSTATLAGATVATTATAAAAKAIVMTTLQKTLIATAILAGVGTGFYEARQASLLRDRVHALQQQQGPLADQMQQLQRERDESRRQVAALREENERLSRNTDEVLKLRNENTRLRSDYAALSQTKSPGSDDPLASEAVSWKNRVNLLKQRLEQTPAARIPELQLLSDQDWLDAAKGDLKSEKDYRQALARLRSAGESKFVSELQPALTKYREANNGQFPTDLTQLQPYLKTPADPAILDRWEIVPASKLKSLVFGGDWVITQRSVPDGEFDLRYGVGSSGYGSAGPFTQTPSPEDTLTPALQSFYSANNGQMPSDPSQLLPYLTSQEQRTALDTISESFKSMSADDRSKMWAEAQKLVTNQASK